VDENAVPQQGDDIQRHKPRVTRRRALGTLGGVGLATTFAAVNVSAALAQEATPAPRVIPTPDPSLAFKVVLHVATPDGWPFALSNLSHLTQSYPLAEVLCVVDGTGVYTLQGTNDLTAKMATVFAAGARLQVCGAALQEHQIDPATLPEYAEIVAGGVVALVQAQQAGFAYVRP
jgi:intracellular sulfur oxidation DsrE/DsrF family protein